MDVVFVNGQGQGAGVALNGHGVVAAQADIAVKISR